MLERLLPATHPHPVWRRDGLLALEARLQAQMSTPLMDLAGLSCARLALAVAPHAQRMVVAAGPGNNGGDGLQAAQHLHQWGKKVQVHLLARPENLPKDALRAFENACQAGVTVHLGLEGWPDDLQAQDLCIDALLGTGATRAPQGLLLDAIHRMHTTAAPVLAIDVPTGLNADSGQALGDLHSVVHAQHTLTLLAAKPGLFMRHGRDACGTLWLDTLAWGVSVRSDLPCDAELNPPPSPATVRPHASHKGSHGDVAVVGGESLASHTGMSGAALLAAQAALHGGAGRVFLSLLGEHAPWSTAAPELMRRDWSELDLPQLTVVAGCGGGQAIATALPRLLQRSARLVLDADGLNRLAQDAWLQSLLAQRHARGQATVLTPHPLEAARLLGCSTEEVQKDRLAAALQMAEQWDCCVVLKGSGSVIAAQGQMPRINTSGNGLLATGGTGDVLAGLIGARLAAGQDPWSAACSAVWLHGDLAEQWPKNVALTALRLAQHLQP